MDVITSDHYLIAKFDEGKLKGLTIKFWGEWFAYDNCDEWFFGVSSDSGRVIEPIRRPITCEEFEYVKPAVLAYIEADNEAELKAYIKADDEDAPHIRNVEFFPWEEGRKWDYADDE